MRPGSKRIAEIVSTLVIAAAALTLTLHQSGQTQTAIPYTEFLDQVRQGAIASVTLQNRYHRRNAARRPPLSRDRQGSAPFHRRVPQPRPRVLTDHQDVHDRIAKALLERESLDSDEPRCPDLLPIIALADARGGRMS